MDVGGPRVEPGAQTVVVASSFDQAKKAILDQYARAPKGRFRVQDSAGVQAGGAVGSGAAVIAELASSQRGYALGFAESAGIAGRAGGAVLGAILFERYGMTGPALATGLSGIAALGLIGLHKAGSTAA